MTAVFSRTLGRRGPGRNDRDQLCDLRRQGQQGSRSFFGISAAGTKMTTVISQILCVGEKVDRDHFSAETKMTAVISRAIGGRDKIDRDQFCDLRRPGQKQPEILCLSGQTRGLHG